MTCLLLQAARDIHALGPQYVLVKGGHLSQPDPEAAAASLASQPEQPNGRSAPANDRQGSPAAAVDALFDGHSVQMLAHPHVRTGNTHGTGCTLASAIAAELAKGHPPVAAIRRAKGWVNELLQASAGLQLGTGGQRPMHHG